MGILVYGNKLYIKGRFITKNNKINEKMNKIEELIKVNELQTAVTIMMNELAEGNIIYDFKSKIGDRVLASRISSIITSNIMHGKLIKDLAKKKDFFGVELVISKQGKLSYKNISAKKYYYLEELESDKEWEGKVSEITKKILEKLYIDIKNCIEKHLILIKE